jgi:3-hydroxyacyl-[acyl-carrier-protein] dehydratase
MPAVALFDRSVIDLSKTVADLDEIRACNPQRFEMEQLSRIVHLDMKTGEVAGVLEIPEDPWWARGHIPGRPLMPGVLMLECAAQLCSFAIRRTYTDPAHASRFFGFGGLEAVKFRNVIFPSDTLLILARPVELRARRAIYQTQGYTNDRMCFEARIIGMWV